MMISVRGNLFAPTMKRRVITSSPEAVPLTTNRLPFQLSLGATRERGAGREIKVYALLPATQKQHLNVYKEQHISHNNSLHEVIYLLFFKARSHHNNSCHLQSTYSVSVIWQSALGTFFIEVEAEKNARGHTS